MGKIFASILAFFGLGHPSEPPKPIPPANSFLVREITIADEKAIFATIESSHVVPARVRTGGTIVTVKVRQGDHVNKDQLIAIVDDPKLALTVTSYAAQVEAAKAQVAEAKVEFDRTKRLIDSGAISRNSYDEARTKYSVALGNLKSMQAQRAVILEQQSQGKVLAPTSGRVITVPVTSGTVVMSGDVVATVAEQNFILRLQVPERHARYLNVGDAVRLDGADLGLEGPRFGKINLIYPDVQNGRVVADVIVHGLNDYFVGQRVRVWVPAGSRHAIVVPENLIITRYGIDYAHVWNAQSDSIDVPVQRGQGAYSPGKPSGLEILSGLRPGDRLLHP